MIKHYQGSVEYESTDRRILRQLFKFQLIYIDNHLSYMINRKLVRRQKVFRRVPGIKPG